MNPSAVATVVRKGITPIASRMLAAGTSGMNARALSTGWKQLPGSLECAPVSVILTLECGQVFGWKRNEDSMSIEPIGSKRSRPSSEGERSPKRAHVQSPSRSRTNASPTRSALQGLRECSSVLDSMEYTGVIRCHADDRSSRSNSCPAEDGGRNGTEGLSASFAPLQSSHKSEPGSIEESATTSSSEDSVLPTLADEPGFVWAVVGLRSTAPGGLEYRIHDTKPSPSDSSIAPAVEESLRKFLRIGEIMDETHSKAAQRMDSAASSSSSSDLIASASMGSHRAKQDIMHGLNQYWAETDERYGRIARSLPGLRVLQQDPVECLVSFLLSSNNNIARINLILDKLRERYGSFIC